MILMPDLFSFAYVPNWYSQLDMLAEVALPEPWRFKNPIYLTKNPDTPILERYIHAIFKKQLIDYKDERNPSSAADYFHIENEFCCFHTGLYTRRYKAIYFRSVTNNGYSGDLEIALIPEWFRTEILQEKLDAKGVLVENSGVGESVKFALLFEFDGDVNAIRHVLYNCSASRPSIESETKEDTIEPGTETLSITADPRSDGLVKARTGDTTDAGTYTNWYKAVYTPTEEEPEEISGEDESV